MYEVIESLIVPEVILADGSVYRTAEDNFDDNFSMINRSRF